jgi:hypothetical protein
VTSAPPPAPVVYRTRPYPERGSGLLSTTIGVAVMIAMLGFAANVTLGLWTRSTVDAIAYDAARDLATSVDAMSDEMGDDPTARLHAERAAAAHVRASLGRVGRDVEVTFEHTVADDVVILHVRAPGVSLLPRMIGGGPIVGRLDRRIVIRREADG